MYCLFLCRYDIPSHIQKGTQGKHQSPPPAPKKAVLQLKYLELWTMRAMSFPCSLPVYSFRKQCPEVSSKLYRFLLKDDRRNTFFSANKSRNVMSKLYRHSDIIARNCYQGIDTETEQEKEWIH